MPDCGKEWEDLPKSERPMFWTTPASNGVRFRVAQLIFETNDDAIGYVKRTMPSRLNDAILAWR